MTAGRHPLRGGRPSGAAPTQSRRPSANSLAAARVGGFLRDPRGMAPPDAAPLMLDDLRALLEDARARAREICHTAVDAVTRARAATRRSREVRERTTSRRAAARQWASGSPAASRSGALDDL